MTEMTTTYNATAKDWSASVVGMKLMFQSDEFDLAHEKTHNEGHLDQNPSLPIEGTE